MMGLWNRILGKLSPAASMQVPLPDLETLARPAVQLVVADVATLSHFGGVPCLPQGIAWPERDGKRLDFLARLSLPEVQRAHPVDWLPASGALLFFYDMEGDRWGFDPSDRGSFAVLRVPDLMAPHGHGDTGSATEPQCLPRRGVACRRIDALPSLERGGFQGKRMSDEVTQRYLDAQEAAFQGRPRHQVSGYPSPVQGDDMELQCQLVTHGLYCGDSSGYRDPRAAPLRAGAAEWRLLLQMDTDDELDVMWGDCGTLCFWVQEQKARTGDFADAWLAMQCY